MKTIFEVEDVLKRKILLTEESFKHILEKPAMLDQEDRIKETLTDPEVIKRSSYIPTVFLYYRVYAKSPVTQKYLLVVVQITNSIGYVKTSFYTDGIKKGESIWER